jgi:hypothetical protein
MKQWLFILIPVTVAQAADICSPAKLTGPYAFQLSGSTTISGTPQPTVSVGRIVFDGSGKLSGTSSAMFSGLLLGNPVTGSYEAKEDCMLTWQLQDDSGAYQHFSGKLSQDLERASLRQTDPGGVRGILAKTSDSCASADLRKSYDYAISGSTKAMQPGARSGSVSARGKVESGEFQVDSDCSVHFLLHAPDGGQTWTVRGFLVNGGREILGFQTDPGAMVAVRLTAAEN